MYLELLRQALYVQKQHLQIWWCTEWILKTQVQRGAPKYPQLSWKQKVVRGTKLEQKVEIGLRKSEDSRMYSTIKPTTFYNLSLVII